MRIILPLVAMLFSTFATALQAEPPPPGAAPADTEAARLWQTEVKPILESHCLECHGEDMRSSQLDLREPAQLLAGGKRGPAIVPGKIEESRLIALVKAGAEPHMPPGDDAQLTDDEIQALERWVTATAAEDWASQPAAAPAADAAPQDRWLPRGADPTTVINLAVQLGWTHRNVHPSARCDDRTFVRRIYLDLAGRIPSRDELHAFLADTSSAKREQLVDELLASPEYAEHFAESFDAMLMGRGTARDRRRRRENQWLAYLQTAFHENRPWNQVVREVLLARPDDPQQQGAQWFLFERDNEHQQIAEAVSAGFFGVQIDCAQCHNHPLAAEIEQRHYWGLVAFFRRSKNTDTSQGPRVAESAIGGFDQFSDLSGKSFDSALTFIEAPVVAEEKPQGEEVDSDDKYLPGVNGGPRIPKFSRREQFVNQIADDHPRIARAMVNRIWGMLLGRGLVHPVDKMDSAHVPSHPELLDWLAEDFAATGYDVKRLVRCIVLSQPYQLNSAPVDESAHEDSFAFAIEKPLTAEMLHRSISVVLDRDPQSIRRLRDDLIEAFPEILPEERMSNLQQSLLLSNHEELNRLVFEYAAARAELASHPEPLDVQEAFERVLSRPPDDEELAAATEFLEGRTTNEGMAHLLWALLASAEFRFNH